MVSGLAYVVFVVPVVFTILFSTAVLIGALDTLDRELNMWPVNSHDALVDATLVILGLRSEYGEGDKIELQVAVEPIHKCGILHIQMYNSVGDLVEEKQYDWQCGDEGSLPLDGFATEAGSPGIYTVTVIMNTEDDKLLISSIFTVR